MYLLTHCLALGALLALQASIPVTVVDSYQVQSVYDVPDFACYEPKVREITPIEPEEELDMIVVTHSATVPSGSAEKPGELAWKATADYG